jgi:hypothetical protein
MDAAIQPLSGEEQHAYAVAVGGEIVAHVWWDADPSRRAALGWYVRDLRTPAIVVRLALADAAIDALARERRRSDDAWADAAEEAAQRTTSVALGDAQHAIRDSPYETYEIHVAGASAEAMAATFPGLARRAADQVQIVTGRLSNSELADVLGCARAIGGTVTAVVRVRPELR